MLRRLCSQNSKIELPVVHFCSTGFTFSKGVIRWISIVSLSAFISSIPVIGVASINTCEEIFSNTPAIEGSISTIRLSPSQNAGQTTSQTASLQRSLLNSLWTQVRMKPFSKSEFLNAKEFYLQYFAKIAEGEHDPNVAKIRTKTSEERLALFEVLSMQNGLGLEDLSQRLAQLDPKSQTRFSKHFSKRRFADGFSQEEAKAIFTEVYLLTHVDPRSWQEVLSQPLSKSFETLVQQRAELEFGRTDFVSALNNLGLIRRPGTRAKLQSWVAEHSAWIEVSRTIGVNAASYALTGFFTRPPSTQKLLAKPVFSDASIELLRAKQWSGARESLMIEAGHYPQEDLALTVGMKITSGVLMGVAVAYFAPALVQSTLPPGYTREDEGFFALANDSVRYWFGVANRLVRGEKTGSPTSSPASSPAGQQNQNDLHQLLGDLDSN